jgi:hypothetical protein
VAPSRRRVDVPPLTPVALTGWVREIEMVLRKLLSKKLSQLQSFSAQHHITSTKASTLSINFRPGIENIHLSGPNLLELLFSLLESGHTVRFQARGISMTPALRDGDTVTVSPISAHLIRLGDIVAAKSPLIGRVVLHRAIKRESGGLVICGDNAGIPDGLVAKSAIMGKVICVQRKGQEVVLAKGLEAMILAFLSRHGLLHRLIRLQQCLAAV